jgi:hypothetical protein
MEFVLAMENEEQNEMESYRLLRNVINSWIHLGCRQYANGTLRIGHVPHIAPEGYLHRLLPSISSESLDLLQDEINSDLPLSVCRFLLIHNGIGLYRCINIYGRRTNFKRSDIDAMMEQPYDMVPLNTVERPDNAPEALVFIGSIGDENQPVAVWPDGKVCLWNIGQEKVEPTPYHSLFDFLLGEALKAEKLFDSRGRRVDNQGLI